MFCKHFTVWIKSEIHDCKQYFIQFRYFECVFRFTGRKVKFFGIFKHDAYFKVTIKTREKGILMQQAR